MSAVVVRGFLGWANPGSNVTHSLEAYGPGGRWGNGRLGHLLSDAIAEAGLTEGAELFVVAVPRADQPHGDQLAHDLLMRRIEQVVRDATDEWLHGEHSGSSEQDQR